jgi:hypothetical protein
MKIFCNILVEMAKICWEAPMEGSVLSFLKAEWKVSDTGSVQCWASSLTVLTHFNQNVKSTNKKQELPMMAMFVNGWKRNEQFP